MKRIYLFLFVFVISVNAFINNANAQITVTGSLAQDGVYTSLTNSGGAFAALNLADQSGKIIVLTITDDVTNEAGTNALTGAGGMWTSLTILPSGLRTISGTVAANPLLNLNGADYVTINGLNDGINSLTISNLSTSATSGTATIKFITDASVDTIMNCNILGSSLVPLGTNGGNIFISTAASGGNGNDNIVISNCKIGPAGSGKPSKCVYANGSTTSANIANSNIIINNCEIYDYNLAAGCAGIYVSTGNTDFTISNNSFYQTTAYTGGAGTTYGIYLSNTTFGNNFSITGNKIGGSAINCGNMPWTISSSTVNNRFVGMYLNLATSTASSIQNNIIRNINWLSNGTNTAVPGTWAGIYLVAGTANIGNITGNIIGDSTGTGSIALTNGTSNTYSYGIVSSSVTSANISNNVIGSITATGSVLANTHSMYVLYQNANATAVTINNNTIGSKSTANSINLANATTGTVKQFINCIHVASTGINMITNNTVANINNSYNAFPASSSGPMIYGIYIGAGTNTLTGNTVHNLSAQAIATTNGTGINSSLIGIAMNSSSLAGQTVSQNAIYSLSNTYNGQKSIVGLYYNGPTTGSNIVERNFIYNLDLGTSTNTNSSINGIYINSGTTTFQNNMISLGNNITVGDSIYGINERAGTNNFYFNSIYIGGVDVSTSASATYALNSLSTNSRNILNNIFFNARSNGSGTGKHYAVKVAGTTANPSGLTINYNDYFANGIGGTVGFFNSMDVVSLSDWKTVVGQDLNSINSDPQFINPTSATPDLHISDVNSTMIESNGIDNGVIFDFDGETRSSLTPTDIGADAGNFIPFASLNDATSKVLSPISQIITGSISSIANTSGTAVSVFKFTIADLATTDLLATKVTTIKIKNNNPTASATWINTILGAKLNDGMSDIITGTPVITNNDITFPILSGNLDIASGSTKEITLLIWLKTNGIIDGQTFQFMVDQTSHGFSADGSGSVFASDFGSSVISNIMTIDVVATKLTITVPTTLLANVAGSVTVNATDANDNLDSGNTSSITLSLASGNGSINSTSGLTQSLSGGNYTWNDVSFNSGGIKTIQVTDNGSVLSFVISSSISVYAPLSGIVYVGINGDYPNLTAIDGLFNSINLAGLSGNLTVNIISDIAEDGVIALNQWTETGGGNYTLSINPVNDTIRTLSGSSANGLIRLNGADRVNFDGRFNGSGKYLAFSNNAITGNTFTLINDASNNNFLYLDIRCSNANAATASVITTANLIPGAIAIGTTTDNNGNDNNTISYCDIHSNGANSGVCIYAGNGTTAGNAANNDYNSIDNCNIFDFYLSGTASAGINIAGGNNNYSITNNHIYQTISRNYTSSQTIRCIWITPNTPLTGTLTSASGFLINNNYIGGNASDGSGYFTTTGSSSYFFKGMDISVGLGIATSVQNNTLTNWNITGGFSTNNIFGIDINNGNVNLGDVTGNLIGSTITNGSITIKTTVNNGSFIGLRSGNTTAGGTLIFKNNIVSGIDMIGNNTSVGTGFNGIATSGGSDITIENNTIGSGTLANSINMVSAPTSGSTTVRGIICNSASTTPIFSITNNLIANINSNNTSSSAVMFGCVASIGSGTIKGNIIRNLSSGSKSTSATITGLSNTSLTAPIIIDSNFIYDITSTDVSANVILTGINFAGPITGTNIISRNKIYGLTVISNSASAKIRGINFTSGLAEVHNNSISLGYDINGNSISNGISIIGLYDIASAANTGMYFNTVFIGGSGVNNSTANTFAFQSDAINTRIYQDNIFYNARSNSNTGGYHYAIKVAGASPNPTGLTIDYNDYFADGNGGIFGFYNNTDIIDLSSWKIAVGQDANSYNINPGFTSVSDLHPAAGNYLSGIPIATIFVDIDGNTRSLTNPSIGAYEESVPLTKTLNLTILLEGLYNGTTMNTAMNDFEEQWGAGIADKITVELHNTLTTSIIEASFTNQNLDVNGNCSIIVPNSFNDLYYLVIKHRNSITTWSSLPVSFNTPIINYNFTNSITTAFGDNLKMVGAGKYALFVGDVNQDDVIDLSDLVAMDTDLTNGTVAYIVYDLNGDGVVDLSDLVAIDENLTNGIVAMYP